MGTYIGLRCERLAVVPKLWSADPLRPRVCVDTFCNVYFDIYLFFKLKEQCFVKNNRGTSLIGDMFIFEYLVKTPLLPRSDRQSFSLRLSYALCCYVCCWYVFCSYLKSVMRYQFLILDTWHPNTLYLHEQGCKDPWLFFQIKRGPLTK